MIAVNAMAAYFSIYVASDPTLPRYLVLFNCFAALLNIGIVLSQVA